MYTRDSQLVVKRVETQKKYRIHCIIYEVNHGPTLKYNVIWREMHNITNKFGGKYE